MSPFIRAPPLEIVISSIDAGGFADGDGSVAVAAEPRDCATEARGATIPTSSAAMTCAIAPGRIIGIFGGRSFGDVLKRRKAVEQGTGAGGVEPPISGLTV